MIIYNHHKNMSKNTFGIVIKAFTDKNLYLLLLSVFIIACNPAVQITSSSKDIPKITINSTPTSTSDSPIEKSAVGLTPAEYPTTIPLPTSSLIAQKGNLIYLFHDGYLSLLNILTLEHTRLSVPINCDRGLIPNTYWMNCTYNDKTFWFDPITNEKFNLSLEKNAQVLRVSPDGQYFLVSETIDGNANLKIIFVNSREIETIPLEWTKTIFSSVPVISLNGKYIAYISKNSSKNITIQDIQNGTRQEFFIDQGEIVTLFSWSPRKMSLIVGVNDIPTDMPGIFNHLYLIDIDKSNVELLSKTDIDKAYEYLDLATNSNNWSPNGESFIIPTPQGLCRIQIVDHNQQCIEIEKAIYVSSYDWSPKSDEIAVVVKIKNANDEVRIFKVDNLEDSRELIIPVIHYDQINWR